MPKQTTPRGYVIYAGPSQIDLQPIVAIAIVKSRNSKTSNMVQTYILRPDMSPIDANRLGFDFSICGHCPHKGKASPEKDGGLAAERSCYVNLGQGPLGVYRALCANKYPRAVGHAAIAAIGAGRMVRLGTYGDPAAVPDFVWESLISEADGHTAYSHQQHVNGAAFNPALMMVSADSLDAAKDAWRAGYRTFRVTRNLSDIVAGREIPCPSLRGVTCAKCGLCGGASVQAKSIVIPAHGAGAKHFAG